MKIKLYSARELDKKFPSGEWDALTIIDRHSANKAYWSYYGIPRYYYNKLTRWYLGVVYIDNDLQFTSYKLSDGICIPEMFVKKVKQ